MASAGDPSRSPRRPTPPIEFAGPAVTSRWADGATVMLDAEFVAGLRQRCADVVVADATSGGTSDELAEASRDWWPLGLHWALAGQVARRADAVVAPADTAEVAAVLAWCNDHQVPVTAAGGRSSVTGATVPAFGGVVVDLTGLAGIVELDAESGVVGVRAGTFGADLEEALGEHGLQVGHAPQSHELATVGGWLACRGAGQFSNRYGKAESFVVGLEVVLADGTIVRTGGAPAAAVGPDLTQLFVGSEGTLGVITTAWLRVHPLPTARRAGAYRVESFATGLELCRQIGRAGVEPAVLRLYDEIESTWSDRAGDGAEATLLLLDEGDDPAVMAARFDAVRRICDAAVESGAARPAAAELVDGWLEHRNDTTALQGLTRKGLVVDTMEVAARWSALADVVTAVTTAVRAVAGARSVSCHLSHTYPDGACLYFTFVGQPADEVMAPGDSADVDRVDQIDRVEALYLALWDAAQTAAVEAGANLSHHHGVGLVRGRFVADALGPAFGVLAAVKTAIDPAGVLNPGKLGLAAPFGPPPWPPTAGRQPR